MTYFFLLSSFLLQPVIGLAEVRTGADPNKIEAIQKAAPLNNSVTVSRIGRVLKLDYKLVGSDGKKHSLWNLTDKSGPMFTIYKDGIKVATGNFEYG